MASGIPMNDQLPVTDKARSQAQRTEPDSLNRHFVVKPDSQPYPSWGQIETAVANPNVFLNHPPRHTHATRLSDGSKYHPLAQKLIHPSNVHPAYIRHGQSGLRKPFGTPARHDASSKESWAPTAYDPVTLNHARKPTDSATFNCEPRQESISASTIQVSIGGTPRSGADVQSSASSSSIDSVPDSSRRGLWRNAAVGDSVVPPTSSRDKENVKAEATSRLSSQDRTTQNGGDLESVSIPSAEWEATQRELESLRKVYIEMHKASKKHSKKLEELKSQLATKSELLEEKDREISDLKQKCTKHENLVKVVETSVQCQICMELPERPYALPPCGHVLCLPCIQEWFRTCQTQYQDDDEDDDPDLILMRHKTCPCCRTVVKHRPSPVFMVKAVTGALLKEKGQSVADQTREVEASEDPWQGIFPPSDDEGGEMDDDEDDEDPYGDLDPGELWLTRARSLRTSFARFEPYSSESEDDDYSASAYMSPYAQSSSEDEGIYGYVLPRWEPPTVHIDPLSYDLEDENRDIVLSLLRRGCSWEMVQNFNLHYSHAHGIVVTLRSIDHLYASDEENSGEEAGRETLHHVYLGWNIALDEEDIDGEHYMQRVLSDIKSAPARWRLTPRYDGHGSIEVRRLVPADNVETYSTTDSGTWLDMDL